VDPRTQPPGPADIPPPSTPVWYALEPAPAGSPAHAENPLRAMVLAMSGIVVAVVVALAVGARAGGLALAATLAVAALWRSTSSVGPAGLAIRSRGFDVFLYGGGAATIAVLALTAPGID
jgi:hypothetical protein